MSIIKNGLVVSLLLVWGTITASPDGSDGGPTLLVMGDSLSAAYGVPLEKGWVNLLRLRLREHGYPHSVVNASASGETSRGGRERLPVLLERHSPDVVIIELGGNDGLRGLTLQHLKSNLEAMIRQSRKAGARPLLIGMRMPPNYGPRYTRRFAAVYTDLAEELDVALVPFLLEGVAGDDALMQPDGMHAAATAQPTLLENAWTGLKPLLAPATPARD